jgi:hypothetical protein
MKGRMVPQFHVGQHVEFTTSIRHDMKPGGQKAMTTFPELGVVCKLHRSGKSGVAEIRRRGGGKVSRRLIHVRAAAA